MSLRPLRNRSVIVPVQLIVIVFLAGAYMGVVTADEKDSPDQPAVVTAQKFILVDENGKERGVWAAGGNSVSLVFLDVNGQNWVNVSAVMKKDGMALISVGPSDGEQPFVDIISFGSVASVGVFAPKSPDSTKNFPKASLAVSKGIPVVEVKNLPKKSRATLSLDDDKPKLEMYDKEGELSWQAPQKKKELRGL